jgi:hypothetical protein
MLLLGSIIEPGCIADIFSDPVQQPAWCGQRHKLLIDFPHREDLWTEYVRLFQNRDVKVDPYWREAHNFYLQNQSIMDAGAVLLLHNIHEDVPLPDGSRKEISTLQRCYNKIAADGVDAFRSEFQNDPVDILSEGGNRIDYIEMAQRINQVPRQVVPAGYQRVTAFIDVGGSSTYGRGSDVHWMVTAWDDTFSGAVIDYGRHAVLEAHGSIEAGVYVAIQESIAKCMQTWPSQDDVALNTDLLLVDVGWKNELTYRAIIESAAHNTLPSRGIAIQPGSEFRYPTGSGGKKGEGIRLVKVKNPAFKTLRQMEHYSSLWKTFAFERCRTPMGGNGRIALFGSDPIFHRDMTRHLASERREPVIVKDGTLTVDVWHLLPGQSNHWWDCLVGCAVAARYLGVELQTGRDIKAQRRASPGMSFSEKQRQKKLRG